jgi:hypothetical protein
LDHKRPKLDATGGAESGTLALTRWPHLRAR